MLPTEPVYLTDPFCFEFTAVITNIRQVDTNRYALTLDRTCFYPTGGGQDHDTGTLGAARVADVFVEDNGDIVHVVEGTLPSGAVTGRIDVPRRLAFTQHHSAQHLVSAILDQKLGLETVSSHIGIDSPTTIDVPSIGIEDGDLRRVEDEANAIVFQDREIRSFTITDAQVPALAFRRPPKVKGSIRVVEIEGTDISACGGTHCTRTGMIGTIKIVRAEHRGNETRIYVVAGTRALEYFQSYQSIVTSAARQLDTNPEGIPEAISRQSQLLHDAQKQAEELKEEKATREVKQLVAAAEPIGAIRLVTAAFRDRAPQELRSLASALQNEPELVAVLATFDGKRVTLAISCAADTGLSAKDLIKGVLAEVSGRGGGDARLAQGGGAATGEQFSVLVDGIGKHLRERISEREK